MRQFTWLFVERDGWLSIHWCMNMWLRWSSLSVCFSCESDVARVLFVVRGEHQTWYCVSGWNSDTFDKFRADHNELINPETLIANGIRVIFQFAKKNVLELSAIRSFMHMYYNFATQYSLHFFIWRLTFVYNYIMNNDYCNIYFGPDIDVMSRWYNHDLAAFMIQFVCTVSKCCFKWNAKFAVFVWILRCPVLSKRLESFSSPSVIHLLLVFLTVSVSLNRSTSALILGQVSHLLGQINWLLQLQLLLL